jgi:hypothetical protein
MEKLMNYCRCSMGAVSCDKGAAHFPGGLRGPADEPTYCRCSTASIAANAITSGLTLTGVFGRFITTTCNRPGWMAGHHSIKAFQSALWKRAL